MPCFWDVPGWHTLDSVTICKREPLARQGRHMCCVRACCYLCAIAFLDFLAVPPPPGYACFRLSCYVGLSRRFAFHFLFCAWPLTSSWGFLLPDWLLPLRSLGLCACPMLTSAEQVGYLLTGSLSACHGPLWLDQKKVGTTFFAVLPWIASKCLYYYASGWPYYSSDFSLPYLGLWKLTAGLHALFGRPRLLLCYIELHLTL